jgi:hypothetical protein
VTSIYRLSDGCVGEQPRMISSTPPENTNPSLLPTVTDLFGILWPKFVLFSRMKVCDSNLVGLNSCRSLPLAVLALAQYAAQRLR